MSLATTNPAPRRYITVTADVTASAEFEVCIDRFETDDLIAELKSRGEGHFLALDDLELSDLLAELDRRQYRDEVRDAGDLDLAVEYASRGDHGMAVFYLTCAIPNLQPLAKLFDGRGSS